jgi:hypothetical protein
MVLGPACLARLVLAQAGEARVRKAAGNISDDHISDDQISDDQISDDQISDDRVVTGSSG